MTLDLRKELEDMAFGLDQVYSTEWKYSPDIRVAALAALVELEKTDYEVIDEIPSNSNDNVDDACYQPLSNHSCCK